MPVSSISNGKADSQGPQEHQVKFLKDWKNFSEHQLCKKYIMKSYSMIPFSEQELFFADFFYYKFPQITRQLCMLKIV